MGVKLNVLKAVACKFEENNQLINVLPDLESLKKAMDRYLTNTILQGEAYDSHRNYIEYLQMPVLNGIITLCEELKSANVEYVAIISSYFPAGNIDQDLWETTLEQLMNRQSELIGMITNTVTDKMAATTVQQDDSYENTVNWLLLQKSTVETMIYYYQGKLKKLAKMSNALSSVYFTANYLMESVTAAVNLLNSIQVGTDGNYIMDDVNWSIIEDLENDLVTEQMYEEIKHKLGKNVYESLVNGALTGDELAEAMKICMKVVGDHIDEYKGELGRTEIYLSPNLLVYVDGSLSGEIGEDVSLQCEQHLTNDFDTVLGCCVSVGDYELEISNDGIGYQYKEVLDDGSNFYIELGWETSQASLECGISSELSLSEDLGEIETCVAIGITAHFNNDDSNNNSNNSSNNGWQNEPVSELAYADIPQLDEEVETQLVATVVQDVVADLEEIIAENPNADILMDAALAGMDFALFCASLAEATPYIHIPKKFMGFIGDLIKYGTECFVH